MTLYFDTPNYHVALNPKVGSSSLSLAILKQFYTEQYRKLFNASYPEGHSILSKRWHALVPKVTQATKPVVLLIRDPVERFRSAMAQIRLSDVEGTLELLRQDGFVSRANGRRRRRLWDDEHFVPQYRKAVGTVHLFRFPEHLERAANLIGLDLPLPSVNEASRPKPMLTNEQVVKVEQWYSRDCELYENIIEPLVVTNVEPWQKTSEPESIGHALELVATERWKRRESNIKVGEQIISCRTSEDGEWLARKLHAMGIDALQAYPYKPYGGSPTLLTQDQAIRAAQCREWYINACFETERQLAQAINNGADYLDVMADATWPQQVFAWQP